MEDEDIVDGGYDPDSECASEKPVLVSNGSSASHASTGSLCPGNRIQRSSQPVIRRNRRIFWIGWENTRDRANSFTKDGEKAEVVRTYRNR